MKSLINLEREEIIDTALDRLFTNGQKQKADRLLLIQEPYSGAARVQDATYLGGYSKEAVRRILLEALEQQEVSKP